MKRLFSTNDVHPSRRIEYWHEIACREIVKHNSQPECRWTFEARIDCGALADIKLFVSEYSSMSVARTARHVSAAEDDLLLCRQIAGRIAFAQLNREVLLGDGDVVLLDPLLPFTGKFSQGSKRLVVKVPRIAVQARLGHTPNLAGRIITATGEGGILSSYLMALPGHADRLVPSSVGVVLNQLFDLLAVSVARVVEGETPKVSSATSLTLIKLRAAIESRLSDPMLDDDAVAASAGISVRYANSLLSAEGMSIMRLVQARRLERCRAALEYPMQDHRTLSEIAFGWGFSDMTHFGRRFKAAYGIVPSEYRINRIR